MATDRAENPADEKIPARFRKTKTDKWAVMAPVADLEKALAEAGGKVDVLKKSGDWTTFRIASLGRPFDVDGVEMCYGYAEDDDADGASTSSGGGAGGQAGGAAGDRSSARSGGAARGPAPEPPPRDDAEPLPEYQGSAEDEWSGF